VNDECVEIHEKISALCLRVVSSVGWMAMVQLFHRELGGAGRPPMVILHGLLGSSRNWQTAGADLAERYHVFALDLRNHGRSPHADSMSYEEMGDDVLAWLNAQKIERATLVGHSMGGKVAMLIACRHPQRVERLIVVDIAPRNYFWPGHRASFAAMNELNLADIHSRAEAELRFEARVPSWPMRKFLTTNLDRSEAGEWFWQINLPVISAALPAIEKNPLGSGDRFDGETIFLAGGKSNYVEAEDHAAIRTHFPAAQLRILPNSGHNPHMESRDEFVATLVAKS
jgi:pimeloyl-ACP methyl ester carboxylesterase